MTPCMCLDSYDSNEIQLEWFDEDPIEIKLEELNLPQFQMDNFIHGFCNESYKTGTQRTTSFSRSRRTKAGYHFFLV